MLHIRDVTVGEKGNIDDRVYISFTIEGLATERAVKALKDAIELHYNNGRTVINGDAAIPVADLIAILERNNDFCEGRG